MIYLIESYGEEGKKFLKIGYAKDIQQRMRAYDTHNPGYKLLKTREGGTELESYFHRRFSQFLYKNEWFNWNQKIIDDFSSNPMEAELKGEEIDSYLKKLLDDFLLPVNPYKLYKKYSEKIIRELKIRDDWHNDEENTIRERILECFVEGNEIIKKWVDSLNPREVLLSDANIECLAVDISMDLIQILGRQRLGENPWKNSAIFRFKTNTRKISQEEFNSILNEKIRRTESLLNSYDVVPLENKHDLANVFQSTARREKYRNNYVAVNTHTGSDLQPCFNELVLVAEQRAFDIQQVDYKNRFSIMAEITDKVIVDDRSDEISNFLKTFESLGQGRDKMKYLCEFLEGKDELKEETLMNVPLTYKNYYTVLGPKRCWSFSYQMCKLESEYQKQLNNQKVSLLDIRKLIYSSFKEGERYSNSDIKDIVQKIYDYLSLRKKKGKLLILKNGLK